MEIKTTHQVSECFYNGTWKSPVGQSDPFVPALASMASSPAATNAADDGRMMGQPVQRFNLSMFGSQIRPNFGNHPSSVQFPADPGFERMVTSFSCFSGLKGKLELPSRNTSVAAQDGNLGSERRKSGLWRSDTAEKAELVDSEKESSVSEQAHLPAGNSAENSNSRKRKSFSRGKAKEHLSLSADEAKEAEENDESGEKRSKQDEVAEKRTQANGRDNESQKQSKENSKPTEPPKDYIHVRARRGQATDSHSLAERVRREKISERMKLLQDLVPGCNKVTGKAIMLDEIINYVQSLQRQVEFLSMKLATVNPGMDFSMDSLLSKDMNQIFQTQGSLPHGCHPLDSSMPVFPFGGHVPQDLSGLANNVGVQFLMNQANGPADRSPSMHLHPVAEFGNSITQVPSGWEDDLQSIVQMGFTQNQPESFHRSTVAGKLKIEL